MTLRIYKNAVQQFLGSLDEVREYTTFVLASSNLRTHLNSGLDWNKLYGDGRQVVTTYFSTNCDSTRLSCNAAIMAVSSSFEEFIRRLLRDAVDWVNDAKHSYGNVSPQLIGHNITASGKVLATFFEPPGDMVTDYESICLNLAKCCKQSTAVVLNSDAFTFGVTSANVRGIEKALTRLGVTLNWSQLASADLQTHCNVKGAASGAKSIQEYLDDFIKNRNKLAHQGLGTILSTPESNAKMLGFFELFAPQLAQVVENSLLSLHAKKKS